MIKITRPPAPNFFESKKLKSLKAQLWEHHAKDTQQRKKFQLDQLRPIREDLIVAFRHKCAYCESKIGVSADFDLENFRPKNGVSGNETFLPDHYFWLAYDWENLLPSCQICNRNKRNHFPIADESKRAKVGDTGSKLLEEENLLLDPCHDQPEVHLDFLDDGTVLPLSPRGRATIEILNLNRKALVAARQNAAVAFKFRLEGKIAENELTDLSSDSPSHEYAATLRSVYQRKKTTEPTFEAISVSKEHLSKLKFEIADSPIIDYIKSQKRFSIRSVEIQNFRTIRHLKLDIKPTNNETEEESWMLLLGDNGVGKSSILQAIAMTLCGKNQLRSLKLNVADFLRKDTGEGFIKIQSYEYSEPIELFFTASGFKGMVKEPPAYIMGYGATRLLPRRGLGYSNPLNPIVNIHNLFDYSYPLSDINAWLQDIDQETFNTRIAPALFDLLDLNDGERVQINAAGRLEVEHGNGLLDVEKTSDGYKSIIALACDIMKTLSNEPSGYHSAHGIVLIDELGNHLHPRWRMKIVRALRSAFPKLQFIVSTHEPLCLRGLLHGEVVVLAESMDKTVFAIDQRYLPDHSAMRIDQLLTSDLFGLINVLDPETERQFSEYYTLLSIPTEKRNDQQEEKIRSYTRLLGSKEMIGSTPQVQAVYQLVNERFAKGLLDSNFKTQQQLKEETIIEVREMLNLGKLDWL